MYVDTWNVVQDYRVDTVNYIGENNPKSKLEMDLVDVWRDKNPGVRRYTWQLMGHIHILLLPV
jgi:hypothetical protein